MGRKRMAAGASTEIAGLLLYSMYGVIAGAVFYADATGHVAYVHRAST